MSEPLASWQHVWRHGFAPSLPTAGLRALRDALAADDVRLVQQATTVPPPLRAVADWPCEGACAISYAGWHGELGAETVGDVEELFAAYCFDADQRLGEPGACRYFLNWFDQTPRQEAFRDLLGEVEHDLTRREMQDTTEVPISVLYRMVGEPVA